MSVELKTVWVSYEAPPLIDPDLALLSVGAMLDDGWELVQWQPVVFPPVVRDAYVLPERAVRYDVFLLRRG